MGIVELRENGGCHWLPTEGEEGAKMTCKVLAQKKNTRKWGDPYSKGQIEGLVRG